MTRMRKLLFPIAALALASPACSAADKKKAKAWTDAETATAEDPDFSVQGEYTGEGVGLQAAAKGGGNFYVSKFKGGLPGAGWDGSAPEVATMDTAKLKEAASDLDKVERESPTLGAKPPEGAVVLFGGEANDLIKGGDIADGLMWAGAQTTGEYGDFKLHLEFRLPYKPEAALTSQDRGNSGIYLQNRYETQVLDTFGVMYDKEQIKVPLKSDPKQWCGCFYKFKTADIPMCFPPLRWQTYDIDFTAPKFDADGKKVANARISVVHNGVKIHDDVELPKGTGAGGGRKEVPKGPIIFQGHGNPVAYRNIWLVEK